MANRWGDVLRGVAIGDSWGSPVEFSKIVSILSRYGQMGPDIPSTLEVTDDTQMTLYLAKALHDTWGKSQVEVRGAIIKEFLAYNRDPDNNRAPGVTVTSSLNALGRQKYNWKSATSSNSDGSGTVMRTSPCAFLPEDRWVGITAFAAAVTHGTPNGVAAAILDVAVLRKILTGETKPGNLLEAAREMAENPEAHGLLAVDGWIEDLELDLLPGFKELARLIHIALEKLDTLQSDPWLGSSSDPSLLIGGGGWRAHETLVIALLAVDMLPDDVWGGIRRAVVTNGDSDTIAAVAGALVGASYPGALTAEWNAGLREAFEPRYLSEIEAADDYAWTL